MCVQSPIRYPWPRSLKEARHVLTRRPLWHPTASWVDLSQKMNIVLNNTALCLTHISFEKNNLIIIAIICTFIVYIFFVFSGTQFEKNEETKEEVDLVIRFLWHFFLRPENRPRGSLTHLSHSESRNFLFRVKVETRHALSTWPTYLWRNGHWKWRAHSSCHCSDVGHLELSRLGFQGLLTATKASYVHKLTRLGSACFWILMLMMMLMIAMLMMRMMSKIREHFSW